MKIFRNILILAVILIIACTFVIKKQAKNYVQSQIEQSTGYQTEIGDIFILPNLNIVTRNIKIKDGEEVWLEIDRLESEVTNASHIKKLHLDGVRYKYIPSKKEGEAFPFITIDDLKITGLKLEYGDPFDVSGSITASDKQLLAHLEIDKKIQVEAFIQEKQGHFHVKLPSLAKISGNFELPEDHLIRFSDLHLHSEALEVDGDFAINKDWKFEDSLFHISTQELSQFSPVKGQLFALAEIQGEVMHPQLELKVGSEKLEIEGHVFEKIEGVFSNNKLSLEFIKEQHPYRFSSTILSDNPLAPKLSAALNITDILQIFKIDSSNIEGKMVLGIDLGNPQSPARFEIVDGFYESYVLGSLFSDINALLEINDGKLLIKSFSGKDRREGTFAGSGSLILDPSQNFAFDLQARVDQMALIYLDTLKTKMTGLLQLTGDTNGALLKGNLVADSITYSLSEKSSAAKATVAVVFKNETIQNVEKEIFPTALDIIVTAPQVLIKSNDLKSEWNGNLHITGPVSAFQIHGDLKVTEGRYLLRGKKLEINKGLVTFDGDIEKNTQLYVIAEMEIDNHSDAGSRIHVEIIVKGPAKNPSITLQSNPPMSQKEILSWILFNKGLSAISQFQGTQLNESITDLLNSANTGPDLLTRLQNTIGIDRIDFSGDQEGGMSVQFGKYISKRTYLTVSRRFTTETQNTSEAHSVGIETHLFKNVRLQAEIDDTGNGQGSILWKHDY